MGRLGLRSVGGGRRADLEPSATAPWRGLVCQEVLRVFCQRRSLRLSNQSFTFGFYWEADLLPTVGSRIPTVRSQQHEAHSCPVLWDWGAVSRGSPYG